MLKQMQKVFNSRKYKATTTTDFFERYNEFQWRQRQINASFTYRFNQKLNKRERSGQKGNGGDDMDFEG